MYYWRIDRDYLVDGMRDTLDDPAWPSRVGTGRGEKPEDESILVRWRALDDDGEVYYGGAATDSALEDVYEWTLRDAGATVIEVKQGDNWVAVIA